MMCISAPAKPCLDDQRSCSCGSLLLLRHVCAVAMDATWGLQTLMCTSRLMACSMTVQRGRSLPTWPQEASTVICGTITGCMKPAGWVSARVPVNRAKFNSLNVCMRHCQCTITSLAALWRLDNRFSDSAWHAPQAGWRS